MNGVCIFVIRLSFEVIKLILVSYVLFAKRIRLRLQNVIPAVLCLLLTAFTDNFGFSLSVFIGSAVIYFLLEQTGNKPWFFLFSYIFVQVADSFITVVLQTFVTAYNDGIDRNIKELIPAELMMLLFIVVLCGLTANIIQGTDEDIYEIGLWSYLELLVMLGVSFLVSGTLRLILDDKINETVKKICLIIMFLMLILLLLSSYVRKAAEVTLKKTRKDYEHDKELFREREKYWRLQNEQYEKAIELRHNIRVIIDSMQGLVKTDNADLLSECYKEIENELALIIPEYDCGNAVISALMLEYSEKLNGKGICIDWSGHIHEEITLKDTELAAVFGNLLINAIEECERLGNNDDRIIEIEFLMGKGVVFIDVSNPTEKADVDSYEAEKSEKKENERHGIGIKSIRRIIDRYDNASYRSRIVNGVFKAEIMLPVGGRAEK